jgi:hypothetical protein
MERSGARSLFLGDRAAGGLAAERASRGGGSRDSQLRGSGVKLSKGWGNFRLKSWRPFLLSPSEG